MNKTLIALAIAAAAVATGVNAGEIYNKDGASLTMGGRAEARLSLQDGKAEDKSRVRLNFLGKVAINDGLYGVGFYEGEFTTNDAVNYANKNVSGSDLNNRYTYAGIGGTYGEVTYGKNDGALGVITDFTDIMAYHGSAATFKLAAADRADNMLAYKGQFGDLGVKASYRFADRNENANATDYVDNGKDGYSLSATYALGETGFKIGAGYADQDVENEYMLGASYSTDSLYFAGLFTDGEKAATNGDFTGYELAAAYTLGQATFSTTYGNSETNSETSANSFAIDATYFFKPNFRTYISYNFNMIDSGDVIGIVGGKDTATKIDAEDELAIGLRYDF